MGQTRVIACGACRSVIDLENEQHRILSRFEKKTTLKPRIPLGTRGRLHGETYEVIGFLCRTAKEIGAAWREYLLFNPRKGFRWLHEFNGHWTYLTQAKDLSNPAPGRESITYLGREYKRFDATAAEVTYVLGEFHWQVKVGDQVFIEDYVAPPEILSLEISPYHPRHPQNLGPNRDAERVWSSGTYLEPEEVKRAFSLPDPLPERIGIAPNQPAPYTKESGDLWLWAILFLVTVTVFHFSLVAMSQNKEVFNETFTYSDSDPNKVIVTPSFELSGRTSNVLIQSSAKVENSWIYLTMTLINSTTGEVRAVGREIAYYSGSDVDGSWSEGRPFDEVYLSSVPAGTYYLTIDPEAQKSPQAFRIVVRRDVPRWIYYGSAVGLLLAAPLVLWGYHFSFESRRWAESTLREE
jgi:hypothetical protein